ncbi:hypothetical protein [Onishia taeanensis]
MFDWITGRKPPPAWVIKQCDSELLHLCGRAIATDPGSARKRRKALAEGAYQGPIRIEHSSTELSAELFAALIPIDDLEWLDQSRVRWQDRRWWVAWVPKRCWAYRGPLTLDKTAGPDGGFVSTEDVSAIRAKASAHAASDTPRQWLGLEALVDEQRRFDHTPIPPRASTHPPRR